MLPQRRCWSCLLASAHAVVRGGVEVVPLPDTTTSATYEGRPVLIVKHPKPTAIVGVPLDATIGKHTLVVESAEHVQTEIPFKVVDKKYPTQRLTLNEKMVNPPPEELARIEQETLMQNELYDRFSAARRISVSHADTGCGTGEFELRVAAHTQRPAAQPARRPRRGGAYRRAGRIARRRNHCVRRAARTTTAMRSSSITAAA